MTKWVAIIASLCLSGCIRTASSEAPWLLGFLGPAYMQVHIEESHVIDVRNRFFAFAFAGNATQHLPPELVEGAAAGWPELPFISKSRRMIGADLPRQIIVRWQSLVEPQTYEATINLDAGIQQRMRERIPSTCNRSGESPWTSRRNVLVGLAPGGVVKVWVQGECGGPVEVLRTHAEIVPQGPRRGLGPAKGEYNGLSEGPRAYIEKYGIPYGSW